MIQDNNIIWQGNEITNDEITRFINTYYKPLSGYLARLREEGERDEIPIILKSTEIYLNTLTGILRPKKILEIGTAIGYSAIYFATSCEDADVFTCEKDEEMYGEAYVNVKNSPCAKRIHTFLGDGEEIINSLYEKDERNFDLVFIDAAKSHYLRFFQSAMKLCRKGSVIISDNIFMHGMTVYYDMEKYRKHRQNVIKMRGYLDYICNEPKVDTSLLAVGDGIAVTVIK